MKKSLISSCICLCLTLPLMACSPDNVTHHSVTQERTDGSTTTQSSEYFDTTMLKIAQGYFALRPEIASYYGITDEEAGEGINARLSHYDPESEIERRQGVERLLKQLDNIDQSKLSDSQAWSVKLIKTEMAGAYLPATKVEYGSILGEYGAWFLPYVVSHLSGPHVGIQAILEEKQALRNEQDAYAFIERVKEYFNVINGAIKKLKHDQKLGVIAPDFVLENTINNLQGLIEATPEHHSLTQIFVEKLTSASVDNIDSLKTQLLTAMKTSFYPATKKLISTLQQQLPLATHEAGVSRLPNGKAFYQAMITHLSDSTLTAEAIHQIGLDEVARIHKEMDVLLKQVGYTTGTVGQRMQQMLNDPKYIYPNTKQGKAQLMADIKADLELANAKLPQWFATLPQEPVAIKAVPKHREQSVSGAFYDAPSQDGSSPGTYWISLYDTASNPSYSLQTLTYHEANPGHHLQTLLGLSDANPILTTIFYSNAAAEGWGLYAERLAAEMGIYENDPVDDIGRLQAELHRAVRLVVDTGMHALGWSREKAIDYSIATEGVHPSEAKSEVERYVVWPGQALGYKLGELKIVELRQRAKQKLGDKFDIRYFHDAILESGALPLPVLEQKIDNWINNQL